MAKLSAPKILAPILKTQVSYNDWNQLTAFISSMGSLGVALSQGFTSLDALPPIQPVSIVTDAGSLVLLVGGTDNGTGCQWALCQGILCASVGSPLGSQVSFTVPSNTTGTDRIDAIVCQPITVEVDTVTRPVYGSGNQSIPEVIQGLAFEYVQGPNGGGNPTIPSGWEKFALIDVANGASGLTDDNVTLFFPYMNADGFTVASSTITVPDPNGSPPANQVPVPVNDASFWAIGDFGYCVGPNSKNGFLFQVTDIDELQQTLLLTNINTLIQGSGSIPVGAYLLAAALAPVCCTTTSTTIPVLGGTVDLNVTNSSDFPKGAYGVVIGRVYGQSFYFQVINNLGPQINVQVIGIGQGGYGILSGSAGVAVGSSVLPCAPPAVVEEDQDAGTVIPDPTPPMRVKKGSVTFSGGGVQSAAVAFFTHDFGSGSVTVLPYSHSYSYGVALTPDASAGSPVWVSAMTQNGFTIHVTDNCTVHWTTIGY